MTRISAGLVAFGMFLGGSCLVWIPVIGWVLAPILFLVAIGAMLSAALPSGSVVFQCSDCKQWTRRKKAELPA